MYSIGDITRQRGTQSTQTITSLTSVTTTATATVTGHGFITGQSVLMSGAVQANYNIQATITVVDANTFTYSITATTSPATGSPVVYSAVAAGNERVFRCTTAGTSASSEPAWTLTKSSTTTSNTAIFTEITGNSTYNWSVAAARLSPILNAATSWAVGGDRIFLSSDHTETWAVTINYNTSGSGAAAGTPLSTISVNRAGSVPPVAGDITAGAAINIVAANGTTLSVGGWNSWQGVTFTAGSGSNWSNLSVGSTATQGYFTNCAFVLASSSTAPTITTGGVACTTIFDNCTVQFGNAAQYISTPVQTVFVWKNTSGALLGTMPTTLFALNPSGRMYVTGVDFSATSNAILSGSATADFQCSFWDCRFNAASTLMGSPIVEAGNTIEFINCDSGATGYNNKWYRYGGTIVTDAIFVRSGGASDGVQAVSHRYAATSSTVVSQSVPLDGPPIYYWNTATGSHTATVEVMANRVINNNDLWFEIAYLGSASYPLASLANDAIAPLTVAAAQPTSSYTFATWSAAWNPGDITNTTLSNSNLTATKNAASAGGGRSAGYIASGSYYCEITIVATTTTLSIGFGNLTGVLTSGLGGPNSLGYVPNSGIVWVNNSTIATIATATTNDIIGFAIDLTHSKVWIRKNGGNWNNDVIGNQNPATNTGGISLATLAAGPYNIMFTDAANSSSVTMNTGATSFNAAAPSGFSAWNTVSTQKLQVTFNAQLVGFIRVIPRLASSTLTAWVDPTVLVT